MGVTQPGACLNCGAEMAGPYCARCGQKSPHTDLTLREFLHETTQELTHWEGRVPTTLRALFFTPGLLTQDFLAGRRARWLPPLRLYLICSVAFFLSAPLTDVARERSADDVAELMVTNPDGTRTLTPAGRQVVETSLATRIFGSERIERAIANDAVFDRMVSAAYPKAMFVLLPLFALITRVAWRRTPLRYPAHLYVALHLHAAWFGAMAVLGFLSALAPRPVAIAVGVAEIAYIVWYGLAALRRIFGDSWMRTIAKAAAIVVVYGASLFATSVGMLAYALARI